MSGPLVRGAQGYTQVHFGPGYDPETDVYYFDVTWEGTLEALRGLEANLRAEGIAYQIVNNGPLCSLSARLPQEDPVDQYSISTEATEKSIFEFPDAIFAAQSYDAGKPEGDPTWRSLAEDAIRTVVALGGFGTVPGTIEQLVVNHLRNGVTGWQVDFVTLRRTRRVKRAFAFAVGGKFSLDIGLLLYSSAQLNLPADVAFSLPVAAAHPVPSEFLWAWRKRGQHTDYVGQWIEQSVELLYAPWSLLFYDPSGDNLDW